jgi:hypothetical protein
VALLGAIERQAGEEYNRDWVGHPPTQSRWRSLVLDRAHRQRVVANNPLATAQHVGGGGARCGRGSGGLSQPLVERSDSAVEVVRLVRVVEQLDATQRLAAQRPGMGLRFLA